MPTYEYACTQCENRVEVHQSFTDAPLESCEICGGRLRRIFHAVGVMFKGSGFYSTDAKSSSAKAASNGGKHRESGSSKDSSSSTEHSSESGGSKSKESKESRSPKQSAKTSDSSG